MRFRCLNRRFYLHRGGKQRHPSLTSTAMACPHLTDLSLLNQPRLSQQVHREECTQCFDNQVRGRAESGARHHLDAGRVSCRISRAGWTYALHASMVDVWDWIGIMPGHTLRSNATLLRSMSGAYSSLRRNAYVSHLIPISLTNDLRCSVEGGRGTTCEKACGHGRA